MTAVAPTSVPASGLDAYLGAARVVRLAPREVVVALEESSVASGTVVHATLALAFPYAPVVGDQLLVLGDARAFYVIGVLHGRGTTTLSNAAGVSVSAEGGKLHLSGDRGVRLRGRSIRLQAEELRQLAVTKVETFGEQVRHVRERLAVLAGDMDEHSDGRWLLQARGVVVKALIGARIKSPTVRVG